MVISTGVSYSGGTMAELYRWREPAALEDEGQLEALEGHLPSGGYHVDQEILREPEIDTIDGPVKALCASCLRDVTEEYVQLDRGESLPM